VVHNGQITNYWIMRRQMERKGHRFMSNCDSELLAVYVAHDLANGVSLEDSLRKSIDEIDAYHKNAASQEILSDATDPARGDAAAFVSGLWGSIEEDWGRIRPEINLAIAGRAEEVNLKRVLEIEPRLVQAWERLAVVMVRFINAKYAR